MVKLNRQFLTRRLFIKSLNRLVEIRMDGQFLSGFLLIDQNAIEEFFLGLVASDHQMNSMHIVELCNRLKETMLIVVKLLVVMTMMTFASHSSIPEILLYTNP